MTQQSCNISDCFIAKQWEIKEPEECLACDDDGNCGYKAEVK